MIPDHECRGHAFLAAGGICKFMLEAISGRMTHGPGAGKHSAMSRALWTEQAARGGNGSAGAVETCIRLLRPLLST